MNPIITASPVIKPKTADSCAQSHGVKAAIYPDAAPESVQVIQIIDPKIPKATSPEISIYFIASDFKVVSVVKKIKIIFFIWLIIQ